MAGQAWESSQLVTWEEKAQLLGLDDLCLSALSAVHSERAHQILNDMQSKGPEIRNVSAYVNNAARKAWEDKEVLRRAVETDVWKDLLDDGCKAELKRVDPTWGLSILKEVRSMGNEITSPSAYITRSIRSSPMAHANSSYPSHSDGMHGHGGHSMGGTEGWNPSVLTTWEDKAALLGLDDLCMSALNAVHSERAHQVLNDMQTKGSEIRNVSAYVNNAARKAWDDKEILRRALETDIWSSLLDDSAKGELRNVEPSCALNVLKDVRQFGTQIRNPSSYVCGTVRKRVAEGKLVASVGGFQGGSRSEGQHQQQQPSSSGRIMPLQSTTSSSAQSTSQGSGQAMAPAMAQMCPCFPAMMPMLMAQSMGAMGMMPMAFAPAAAAMAMQCFGEAMSAMQQGGSSSSPTITPVSSGGGGGGGGFRSSQPTVLPKPCEATHQDKMEMDEVIAELAPDLDEKAVGRVYQLGSAAEARKALEVLVAMGDEVRNKSAFINGIVNKRLMAMPQNAGLGAENQDEEVDEELLQVQFQVDMDAFEEELDDQAKKALQEVQAQMGSKAAIQLLKDLTIKKDMGGIRNLSGFAYKMARTRLAGNAQNSQQQSMGGFFGTSQKENEMLQDFQAQMKHWSGELDERAQKIMHDLQVRAGSSVALEVLKELEIKVAKEEIRNMSSFVYKMARQRIQGTPMPGKEGSAAAAAFPAAFQAMAQAAGMFSDRQGYMPRFKGGGGTASLAWIQEMVEEYGLKGKLDETALQVMLTAQQARIIEVLQDMSDMGADVRNPSAFIQKSLKDCPDPGVRKRTVSAALESTHWETVKRAHLESTDDPFFKYKEILGQMDEAALAKLRGHPDQSRVRDILAEMATKILDIRNPSAFVMRALNDPTKGGSLGPMY